MSIMHKSKRGFTLVEMIIVIAIIVILASVVIFAIARYLNAADAAADSASEHINNLDSAMDDAESRIQTNWST